MKKETLKLIIDTMDKMQEGIRDVPHGFALQIKEGVKEIEGIILGEEFGAQEIMYQCENCETLLLSDDEIHSDESGDCHFCAECARQWREAQEPKPDPDLEDQEPF